MGPEHSTTDVSRSLVEGRSDEHGVPTEQPRAGARAPGRPGDLWHLMVLCSQESSQVPVPNLTPGYAPHSYITCNTGGPSPAPGSPTTDFLWKRSFSWTRSKGVPVCVPAPPRVRGLLETPPVSFYRYAFPVCVPAPPGVFLLSTSPRERVLGTCVRPGVAEPDCEPVEG